MQFDTLPEKGKYISLLTNRLEYDVRNTSKNYSHNWSYVMLHEYLPQERYDCIRMDSRFVELEDSLRTVAK